MLKVHASATAALFVIVCAAGACRKPEESGGKAATDSKAGTASTATAPEAPKPVPETLPDVLARINGEEVTKTDFEQFIAQMEINAGQKVSKEQRNEVYRKALDQLVTIKVLSQEVKTRGVKADDNAVDEQMQKIRAQFKTDEDYRKALTSRGVTPDKLRADMLTESRINTMMDIESGGTPTVTEGDVRAFYEKNPERFRQAEAVRASHILIRAKPGDEAARKAARARIVALHKQAKAGRDFADLARRHSEDGSAQSGGDLGFFTKDRMVPEFADAAFAMKPGDVSNIVETSYGYHIIKLADRRPGATVPLEEVTGQVRQFLSEERKREKAEAFVKVLRSKSKIEVLI